MSPTILITGTDRQRRVRRPGTAESFGSAMGSLEEGARAVERLAVDPALEGVTGRYFDGLQESRADPQASDPEARRRLWELSEQLVGLG